MADTPYLLLVDADKLIKVEIWPGDVAAGYVATREHRGDMWGPPAPRLNAEPTYSEAGRPKTMVEKVEYSRRHAQLAFDAYRRVGGVDTDDEAALGDLIADLLHLAEDKGVLPSAIDGFVGRALDHYQYESDPDHAEEGV